MTAVERISGREKLINLFGRWPSFHDSEVLSLALEREAQVLRVRIYLFEMTSQVDAAGFYKLDKKSVATLSFARIADLTLNGFNQQNVLFGLAIADISSQQLEGLLFEVTFDSSFGLEGSFKCQTIDVESVEPYESTLQSVQSPPQAL